MGPAVHPAAPGHDINRDGLAPLVRGGGPPTGEAVRQPGAGPGPTPTQVFKPEGMPGNTPTGPTGTQLLKPETPTQVFKPEPMPGDTPTGPTGTELLKPPPGGPKAPRLPRSKT